MHPSETFNAAPTGAASPFQFDFAPWRLSGQVVGVLLNDREALAAIGEAAHAPPYKAPPKAPVLYLKPRNTLCGDGAVVCLGGEVAEVEIGAALGLVIGRDACCVSEADAMSFVAGAVIVGDLSVPHASFYRPSVRFKARDEFCPLGPGVMPLASGVDVNALAVSVAIDGETVHRTTTGNRVRPAAALIAAVSEFMTLAAGDVLMLGVSAGAPKARAGQKVSITIDGFGALNFRLAGEGGAR